MKNAWRIGMMVFALLWSNSLNAQSQQFLTAVDDLPLMAGLTELVDEAVYFDTPKGRIVEAYAVGDIKKDDILTYYKDSLPALGWKRTAHGTYMRDGEYLSVLVSVEDDTAVVRFSLSPEGK